MVTVAHYRGWTVVQLRGDVAFRREAWIEARRRGLEVRGYAPTTRDQEEELRHARRRQTGREGPAAQPATKPMSPERRAAIVEAVAAARMLDPERARRLLEAARAKVAPVIAAIERGRSRER